MAVFSKIAVGLFILILIVTVIFIGVDGLISAVQNLAEVEGDTYAATIVAAFFTFVAALLPIPAEAPALLNGTLFPPLKAFLLTYVFAYLGASVAYECGRLLGHDLAARLIGETRMVKIETLIAKAGWPTLLALRLSPVMAFTALNWASGVLALSRTVFHLTMIFGLIPGTFVFTIIPHILSGGPGFWLYLAISALVMVGLFAFSVFKLRSKA